MKIEEQIIIAINKTFRNPIYEAMKLLNIKTILCKSNFITKI